MRGASAQWPRPSSLGPKGPIHLIVRIGWHLSELDRCFFVIGANLEGGGDLIGGVLQNYHARSKKIML